MKRLAMALAVLLMIPFAWGATPEGESATGECAKKESCCRKRDGHGAGGEARCGKGGRQSMRGEGQMHGRRGEMGRGQQMRHGRGPMAGGMGPGPSEHHETIHQLMADHKAVVRAIKDVPNGVETITTSKDPDVAKKIVEHTYQMKERLETGQPIRMFDPLFQEIFKHHDKIEMKIEEIDGGVKVTETSSDPEVAALIRQHAKVVSEFAAEGMARMHESSELPEGYRE